MFVVGQICGSQEKLALAVIWRLFEQSLESSPTGGRVTLLPLRPCGEQQLGLSLPLVIIETIKFARLLGNHRRSPISAFP